MTLIFKCPKCGAFMYINSTPNTVYAQPQCDCGTRMKPEDDDGA